MTVEETTETNVTTLPAKAGSFSEHARPNGLRCALKAPSGPERGVSLLGALRILQGGLPAPTAYSQLLKSRTGRGLRLFSCCPWETGRIRSQHTAYSFEMQSTEGGKRHSSPG